MSTGLLARDAAAEPGAGAAGGGEANVSCAVAAAPPPGAVPGVVVMIPIAVGAALLRRIRR
jgi:hypothetical protein